MPVRRLHEREPRHLQQRREDDGGSEPDLLEIVALPLRLRVRLVGGRDLGKEESAYEIARVVVEGICDGSVALKDL